MDDFFRLCARFIQRAPIQFLQCPALPHIIQCALLACSLDHKEANTSVMKFFYDLIGIGQCGKNEPDFQTRKVIFCIRFTVENVEKFGGRKFESYVKIKLFS